MIIKRIFSATSAALVTILFVGGCAFNASAQAQASESRAMLYKRLGGYDAIAAVTGSMAMSQ